MKIVVTSRNFTTPTNTSARELLEAAGHTVVELRQDVGTGLSERAVYTAVGDADAAIAGLEPYGEEVLSHCPNLKLISRRGIGYDAVDLAACARHGVTLARTVGAVEASVAEHVIAYIFYFARRIHAQNALMQQHIWQRNLVGGVKGSTLGLAGFGGIGKEIARRAVPLGMRVLYNCRHPRREWESEYGVRYADLDELLAASDYVSVNVPLTPSTQGMFSAARFAQMKQGSYFINIARNLVMDERALADSVRSAHLGGAAVDVFAHEPCTDSPLHGVPGLILTPHTAPYTEENFATMNRIAAQNVLDFFAGRLDEKYITHL